MSESHLILQYDSDILTLIFSRTQTLEKGTLGMSESHLILQYDSDILTLIFSRTQTLEKGTLGITYQDSISYFNTILI